MGADNSLYSLHFVDDRVVVAESNYDQSIWLGNYLGPGAYYKF